MFHAALHDPAQDSGPCYCSGYERTYKTGRSHSALCAMREATTALVAPTPPPTLRALESPSAAKGCQTLAIVRYVIDSHRGRILRATPPTTGANPAWRSYRRKAAAAPKARGPSSVTPCKCGPARSRGYWGCRYARLGVSVDCGQCCNDAS